MHEEEEESHLEVRWSDYGVERQEIRFDLKQYQVAREVSGEGEDSTEWEYAHQYERRADAEMS